MLIPRRKWLSRLLLLVVLPPVCYAALYPGFAGWQVVPHGLLYRIGVPYHAVLWFEMHFGEIFHFATALLLTLLLPAARLLGAWSMARQRMFWLLVLLLSAVLVELFQSQTGRGFDPGDLLAHYTGMGAAGLIWLLTGQLRAPARSPAPPV